MGPIGAGKSTQAALLAEALGQPRRVYDQVKGRYRTAAGMDVGEAHRIQEEQGLYAMLCYMNEYKSRILGPIIDDHPGHIIDLGGGAQCFDEPEQVERARKVFAPIANVFLLLPSDDLETNIRTLPGLKEDYAINAYLIMHATNTLFAKQTVYTLGKSPEETTREILGMLDRR